MVTTGVSNDRRGQVGIGTLIIFIAMILVATIAAGALIHTAGTLESQAQATGEESAQQVSSGLVVFSSVGEVSDDGEIETVEITVGPTPGSGAIDLESLVVDYTGAGSGGYEEVDADDIHDIEGTVLRSGSDRATIVLDDVELEAGDDAHVTLMTSEGLETSTELVVPYDLEAGETVSL
ncbi:archaellin/type IV pilin N-terminal domain-containing protein [Natrialba sp. INN-245]|uniref:archaellin/type IV pilin N-terminal domain-containing protein n=1 Tax=Natrialba sp. INN-245 TaxID=2690967 RepID=UPI0013113DE6|nr:archaellin/type IV pilin N-terminal domain-containing protein [Natrialba sp. INN-245]MWV41949.1 flagellin A2 [Natrialba sp. INN-245]